MIDVKAALSYLNNALWSDEAGAFKEATTIPIYYQNDNTLARLVMRKYDPQKAAILDEGLLKDYIDPRWCILDGDVTHFVPAKLPDYLRYADLVELQYLYQYLYPTAEPPSANLSFGILSKMYGLKHDGFIYDMATPKEAYTTYKLLLFGLCALRHNHMGLVRQLLETASQFQVTEENESTLRNWRLDELGGIKTEYIPPEWDGLYPQLLVLANCETTSLAIMLQDEYDWRITSDALMAGSGIVAGAIGVSALLGSSEKKKKYQ